MTLTFQQPYDEVCLQHAARIHWLLAKLCENHTWVGLKLGMGVSVNLLTGSYLPGTFRVRLHLVIWYIVLAPSISELCHNIVQPIRLDDLSGP